MNKIDYENWNKSDKPFGISGCFRLRNEMLSQYLLTFIFFSAIYEYLYYLSDINLELYFADLCVYKPREEIYDNPSKIPPCVIKEPKYHHQKEFRAVYIPQDKKKLIEPIIFKHDCIPLTCRIMK